MDVLKKDILFLFSLFSLSGCAVPIPYSRDEASPQKIKIEEGEENVKLKWARKCDYNATKPFFILRMGDYIVPTLIDKHAWPSTFESGNVYVVRDRLLRALDPDGAEIWSFRIGSDRLRIEEAHGNVYVLNCGKLYSLDSKTGELRWETDAGRHAEPVALLGKIFVFSYRSVKAHDAETGKILWEKSSVESEDFCEIETDGSAILLRRRTGCTQSRPTFPIFRVSLLNPDNGQKTGEEEDYLPHFLEEADRRYRTVYRSDRRVVKLGKRLNEEDEFLIEEVLAYDENTGKRLWAIHIPQGGIMFSATADMVLVRSRDGWVYAFEW